MLALVAFAEVHLKVELPPLAIELGLALIEQVGIGGGVKATVMVARQKTTPPGPVNVPV